MNKERLREKYRARVASVTLDIPEFDALAPPLTAPAAQPVLAPSRPADKGWTLPSLPPMPAASVEIPRSGKVRRKRWLWLALASAGILGIAFWARLSSRPLAAVHQAAAIPYTHAMGLAVKEGRLYSVDAKRMLLFAFSSDGTQVTDVSRIANPQLSGLSAGPSGFWSSEATSGRIHRHNADRDHTVAKTYANVNSSPVVLYWTGVWLWASDQRTETIYQYSVQDGLIPLRQYTLPGVKPVGLHVAQDLIWLFDAATLEVRRYRVGPMLSPVDSTPLAGWLPALSHPTGFAVEGSRLWVITENPSQLHRFELSGLAWTPAPSGGF